MSSWSGALHFIFHTFLHPYHRNLFCCSINIMSSIPSLSLNSLLRTLSFTLTLHIHLTILVSARWSATSFSFLTGQVSLLCSILLRTQLLYSLPLLINDISLSVSNGTNCKPYLSIFELVLSLRHVRFSWTNKNENKKSKTNLYCLVKRGTRMCVNNLPKVVTWQPGIQPASSRSLIQCLLHHRATVWYQLSPNYCRPVK